jgi:hypothetical protein
MDEWISVSKSMPLPDEIVNAIEFDYGEGGFIRRFVA